MPFQIRPLKEFLVRPAVPAELDRLPELALNLIWSWQHTLRAVFRRLDPVLWKACNHNPVVLLGRLPQEALERAANDPRYLALYRRACETHDTYLKGSAESGASLSSNTSLLVAYFSMEYGLLDCMPIYSGGLGVLSGDHLKASSDLSLPLVGIGLLYQRGYMSQSFDGDGWQQEGSPVNDFYSLPIRPATRADGSEVEVQVLLGNATVSVKVWRVDVGRVRLYLLDTNIPRNADPEHRDITGQLYAGGLHKRISQEIVLGIGGLRALRELGLQPTVYHMNEGHSAFLAIERIRVLMAEQGLTYEEALEASRTNNVFTTHTPVPAGIDLFDGGLMREYFDEYCRQSGIRMEDLVALGRHRGNDEQEPFSMAVCALRASAACNAVSVLHRDVSQKMWENLWPGLPDREVPITAVTNGVHLPTWINGDLAVLYDQYLEPDWREGHDIKVWKQVEEIPAVELWEAHRRRKRRLVTFVRERSIECASARHAPASEIRALSEALDPEALTIGFARRFATYKRATLIFRDLERLKRILINSNRPVQLLIAGKAHPQDIPGKTLIREIIHHAADPSIRHRVVFVEDYGMQVARELVGGVDIWLNTPRRGEEACGTSGMKAGMNGVLNLSIPDGWFDEAAEESGGWSIGGRDIYSPERDDSHAASLYSLLENEIVPLFYEGREHGMPVEWMNRVKQSLKHISGQFNCERMIAEYRDNLYAPAHAAYSALLAQRFDTARERVRWNRGVAEAWPNVRFQSCGLGAAGISAGSHVPLEAELLLAGLNPSDVRVEALVGRVGATGEVENAEVVLLQPDGRRGDAWVFSHDYQPKTTGRLGFAVRVSSNHFENPLNRPCNTLLKWAEL